MNECESRISELLLKISELLECLRGRVGEGAKRGRPDLETPRPLRTREFTYFPDGHLCGHEEPTADGRGVCLQGDEVGEFGGIRTGDLAYVTDALDKGRLYPPDPDRMLRPGAVFRVDSFSRDGYNTVLATLDGKSLVGWCLTGVLDFYRKEAVRGL